MQKYAGLLIALVVSGLALVEYVLYAHQLLMGMVVLIPVGAIAIMIAIAVLDRPATGSEPANKVAV